MNAHSSWQEYDRIKIQLPNERSDSDLSLKAKNVCVALKLLEVCVFEVVTNYGIFIKFRSPEYEFHQWLVPIFTKTEQFFSFRHNFILTTFRIHLFQWLVPEHSATAVPPAGPCSDLGRDTGGPAASIGWLWMFVKFETCSWKSNNSILSIYFLVPWKHGILCFLWHFQWNFLKISNFIFSIHETTTTDQQCFHYFW